MSFRINENNIFCILPNAKYELAQNIGDFMENDFTIFVEAKILKEGLTKEYPSFFFCRNGRHVGLSAILSDKNEIVINSTYWFLDENGNGVIKEIPTILSPDLENSFNKYAMVCDNQSNSIKLFINGIEVSNIEYKSLNKDNFESSLIWLGCGTMMSDDNFYKSVGDFEYNLLFCLNKKLSIEEIDEIRTNYKKEYLETETYKGLPILKSTTQHRENYKLFCNFENYNRYKLWDMTGNGNYPQLYIENNIHF